MNYMYNTTLHTIYAIDLVHWPCLIAVNRAEHLCVTVSVKHNYMLKFNHKIIINIILCLLNSTRHIKIYSRPLNL